jgi:THO complex subunit 1
LPQISEPLDEGDDAKQIFRTTLGDRLDLTLTLYELVYEQNRGVSQVEDACLQALDTPLLEPGAIFIPLLEELVELISVDNWRMLWSYVETRSKRFTKVC